jgi:hypothetical protein
MISGPWRTGSRPRASATRLSPCRWDQPQ